MGVNIWDTNIPDEYPLTADDVAEFFEFKAIPTLNTAIKTGRAPRPADYYAAHGRRRWFVGQIRAWMRAQCEASVKRDTKEIRSIRRATVVNG